MTASTASASPVCAGCLGPVDRAPLCDCWLLDSGPLPGPELRRQGDELVHVHGTVCCRNNAHRFAPRPLLEVVPPPPPLAVRAKPANIKRRRKPGR